jgi:MFS family permease
LRRSFSGAFNDNGLKQLVIYTILGMGIERASRDKLVLAVGALFSLPFILFSMTGGFFADRFSKRAVTIWTKFFEIAVMALAIAGLGWQNLKLEMVAVFLASTQGALFGPSKYGLLPELLPESRLSWGNGVLELGTFLAVIAGGFSGGWLADVFHGRQEWSGLIFLSLAILGLIFSVGIARVPAADPGKKFRANPIGDLWVHGQLIRKDRVLFLAVLGNTYFWFLGAMLTANIVFYGSDVLHITPTHSGILQAAVAIGIGLGSLTAGYVSSGKVEYGLIPLGSVGMTVFGILLSGPGLSFNHVLALLAALGFSAGFFAVPVNALIQHRPDEKDKGGVIAAANLLSFVGIGGAAGIYYVFQHYWHFGPSTIFFSVSLVTVAATIYVLYLLPDALLRLLLWFATHTLYQMQVKGPRECSCERRSAAGPEPRLHGGRGFADRLHRPTDSLPDVQGLLRSSAGEAVRENHEGDSNFGGAAPARNDHVAAHGDAGLEGRRSRLHFSRRPDDADWADASVPARHGANHEGRGCARHSGESGRRVGLDFQFRTRKVFVEAAAENSVSGFGHVWQTDAVDHGAAGGTAGSAGTWGRGLQGAQTLYAAAASFVCADGAAASFSLRHG